MAAPLSDGAAAMRESPAHVLILSDDDMPLDQAIYIPQVGDRKAFIAGVRGGYLYKFALGGSRLTTSRFSVPAFQDASICYDPVHDKIFCSFWNEHRADDQGTFEPNMYKRLYRINPTTLAVEDSTTMPFEFGFPITKFSYGPTQLFFQDGFVYGTYPYLFRADPMTLEITRPPGGSDLWPSPGWADFTFDSVRNLIWVSTADSGELGSIDTATFSTLTRYDAGDVFVGVPFFQDYGLVEPDLSGSLAMWPTFGPGYGYLKYETGCVSVPSAEAMAMFGVSDFFFMALTTMPPELIGIYADFECNVLSTGIAIGAPNPIQQRFGSIATAEAASAGWIGSIDTAGLGTLDPGVRFKVNDPFNIFSHSWNMADQVKVRLIQTLKYEAGTSDRFNPYGCCYSAVNDKIYTVRNRSGIIQMFDPATSTTDVPIWASVDIGDSDAFPYRIRYNPYDRLLYIPTYKSNKVITVNPVSNQVVSTITGFDSPFDVVIVPPQTDDPADTGKVLAVQHGNTPLKLVRA